MMSVAGDGRRRKMACVTGGDGYIASALVKMLLEKGYAVKTTIRKSDDMEKYPHLKDLQGLGPLEVFRADLEDEGSFDDAVAGCDYAFLVAAPVNLNAENPEAYAVSKVLLEKAAWAFAQEKGISLVTVCPVVVVGTAPATSVNTSVLDILSLLSGDEARIGRLELIGRAAGAIGMVHVDDLCRAEVFVAESDSSSGRYICCSLMTDPSYGFQ